MRGEGLRGGQRNGVGSGPAQTRSNVVEFGRVSPLPAANFAVRICRKVGGLALFLCRLHLLREGHASHGRSGSPRGVWKCIGVHRNTFFLNSILTFSLQYLTSNCWPQYCDVWKWCGRNLTSSFHLETLKPVRRSSRRNVHSVTLSTKVGDNGSLTKFGANLWSCMVGKRQLRWTYSPFALGVGACRGCVAALLVRLLMERGWRTMQSSVECPREVGLVVERVSAIGQRWGATVGMFLGG